MPLRFARHGPLVLLFVLAAILSNPDLVRGQALPAGALPGRLVADSVPAPSLAGNLLGDATQQPAWIYLPPDYDADPQRRYPVLVLLHGVLDDPSVWYEPVYQGMTIQSTMDSLIATGAIRPMIVAMPNGRNALGGSFYHNSPAIGNWADFIARDLVDYLDRHYRTITRAASRAIAGHSMGGYGAIRMGMLNPEVFSIVYGMNPCCLCCMEMEGRPPASGGDGRPLAPPDHFDSIEDLWAELEEGDPWPLIVAATSAALSPNRQRPPFYGDPPYDWEGGELVATEALERWRRAYPVANIAERAEGLRRLRGLAFDSAFDDEFAHIPVSTATFSDSLAVHEVPHVYELYEGDHRNRMRERMATRILPWISARLEDGHLTSRDPPPPGTSLRGSVTPE